jgi:predicted DNA-binding transcriptional regulator AlpA
MARAAGEMERPPYLTHREAAAYCRMSTSTLFVHIKRCDGPRRIRIGGRVFYRPKDLDAWIDGHEETADSPSTASVARATPLRAPAAKTSKAAGKAPTRSGTTPPPRGRTGRRA